MGVILTTEDLSKLTEAKKNRKLILVGGCFDIIHASHIEFLKKSKEIGDILVILLESDLRIRELKGERRPVNSQEDRAAVLSNLSYVDFVINAPYVSEDKDYEILVKTIEPDIIAVTVGNKIFDWEREYINNTGRKIVEVMKREPVHSTTKIVESTKI